MNTDIFTEIDFVPTNIYVAPELNETMNQNNIVEDRIIRDEDVREERLVN